MGRPIALLRGAVALSVVALSLALAGCGGGSAAKPSLRAAFLGDSYTAGVGAVPITDGYAYDVARAMNWKANVVGLSGAGYVRDSPVVHERLAAGIPKVIASRPQVVIVECGHNDIYPAITPSRVEPAALSVFRRLRAGLPKAKIVVIGPIWLRGDPTSQVLATRDAVHAAQRQVSGTLWIDPIADHWTYRNFAGSHGNFKKMVNLQLGHPSNLGYTHFATLIEGDLKRLGVR